MKKRNKLGIFIILLGLIVLHGCASYTLHEREKDPLNPGDTGSKTELKIKGPKADVTYSF